MMYFRRILVPLVLLLVAGGTLPAQTDIPWRQVYESPNENITALAIDPEGGLYVGRQFEGVYYAPPSDGMPVWRSLGREMLPLAHRNGLAPLLTPVSLAISATGSGALYMAADIGGTQRQVFRYSWADDRWLPASSGLEGQTIKSVMMLWESVFAVSTEGHVFRLKQGHDRWEMISSSDVWSLARGYGNVLLAGTHGGKIFRSDDDGDSWTQLDSPGDSLWKAPAMLGYGPDGRVYLLLRDLWRSNDNGETWTRIPNRPPHGCTALAGGMSGEIYFGAISEMFRDAGLYVTTDSGATWTRPVPELRDCAIGGIAIGRKSYVGGAKTLARSDDKGQTWSSNGYASAVSRIDVRNGMIVFVDQGRLWQGRAGDGWQPKPWTGVDAIKMDRNYDVLIGVKDTMVRVSPWVPESTPLPVPGSHMILDVEEDSRGWIYVLFLRAGGERRVSVSKDRGVSWEDRSQSWTQPFGGMAALAIDREDNVYAAVNERHIFRLSASETYWNFVASIEGRSPAKEMAIAPSGNPVVIGSDWIGYCHPESSRVDVQTVTGTELSDIAFAPNGYGVAAGSGGVLFSGDGRSWKPSTLWRDSVGPVSASGEGRALCVSVDESGVFYVGTRGRGIWSGNAGSISSVGGRRDAEPEQGAVLLSLFPNPAAGHLGVRYTLPEGGDATVVLYDLLGHPVRTVPAANLLPGEQTAMFDLHGVPAGAYIAAVKIGGTIRASATVTVTGR